MCVCVSLCVCVAAPIRRLPCVPRHSVWLRSSSGRCMCVYELLRPHRDSITPSRARVCVYVLHTHTPVLLQYPHMHTKTQTHKRTHAPYNPTGMASIHMQHCCRRFEAHRLAEPPRYTCESIHTHNTQTHHSVMLVPKVRVHRCIGVHYTAPLSF